MSQQNVSLIYPKSKLSTKQNKAEVQEKYELCKDECVRLRDAIDNLKEAENKTILLQQATAQNKLSALHKLQFVVIKRFEGHNGKIYDADWSTDCRLLLSGSQDGHLMVWDARTTLKKVTYQLQSSATWVMACSFSPQTKYIACGGLDNICSVYKYHDMKGDQKEQNQQRSSHKFGRTSKKGKHISNGYQAVMKDPPYKTLHHHEGYLSDLEFINDEKIITASGDSTCILWDMIKKVPESVFLDHAGDVTTVAKNGDTKQIFISGSVDGTIKLWDIRVSKCVGDFAGYDADADVNSVCWYPDNFAFAAGSDDGCLRMFDIRAYKELNEYYEDDIDSTVTSVSFSSSGRILFAGYDDEPFGVAWDVAYTEPGAELEHKQSVSSLKVAPNGCAILTSSRDKLLRLWVGK